MLSANINYSKFINYISTQKTLPEVHAMADMLNISTRKIYSLLQLANSELNLEHQPYLVPNTKIVKEQISILTTNLSLTPSDQYVNSYERQLIMDICIALPLKKWTLSEFQSLFNVSRNTVLRNISDLKKREKFKPEFSKKNGFEFKESLYESLVHVYNNLVKLQYNNNYPNHFIRIFDETISHSKLLLVSKQLQKMCEESLEKPISASTAMVLTFFCTITSLYDAQHHISEPNKLFEDSDVIALKNRIEYNVSEDFSVAIKESLSLNMSIPMKLFFTLQLLSISKEKDTHFNSHAFLDLLILSERIVDLFMNNAQIESNSGDKKKLTREVQTQLKPFWYSVNYKSITEYEYLYHSPSFESLLNGILASLADDTLYKNLFSSGLLPDQVTILSMIFYNFSLSHGKIEKLKILMVTSLPIYSQNLFKSVIKKHSSVPCRLTIRHWDNTEKSLTDINNFDLIITELTQVNSNRPTFLIDNELTDTEFERLNNVMYQVYGEIYKTSSTNS